MSKYQLNSLIWYGADTGNACLNLTGLEKCQISNVLRFASSDVTAVGRTNSFLHGALRFG